MIPQTFIDELLNRIDIVDVIEARVTLKKNRAKLLRFVPLSSRKVPQFLCFSRKTVLLLFWLPGIGLSDQVSDGI